MSSPKSLPFVHFVGSVPLATTEDVFTRLSKELLGRLQRIPDGEVAERGNFTEWQLPLFPTEIRFGAYISEHVEVVEQYCLTIDHLKPTGYDKVAISSYGTFCELRNQGVIRAGVRFQVCLPTPTNPVGIAVHPRYAPIAEKLYEQRILEALKTIQENIPAHDLAIQWDMAMEIAHMEHAYGPKREGFDILQPYYSPVKESIVEKVKRLVSAVSRDVQLGFHLCYGDFQHQHFVQPKDSGLLVDLINAISEGVGPIHPIDWFHMPVPKDRIDDGYYTPLTGLDIKGAVLVLGLIHAHGEEGTNGRIQTAKRVLGQKQFGVATECGLGRTPPDELDSIIEIARTVTTE
jgi:hypothetical protein